MLRIVLPAHAPVCLSFDKATETQYKRQPETCSSGWHMKRCLNATENEEKKTNSYLKKMCQSI